VATCPSCASKVSDGNRFCGSCGSPVETPTSAPTETSLKSQPAAISHPSLDKARFIPGIILAKRYRIISLLGRGGMGEVYRADDLKLGQPVALKFLPAAVEKDPARLERFLNEVKIARQIAHPNVCRVYDVGEVDEHHFISMEYVDGEDLASLLRQIGRLPEEKATQIARQLCAGLAAAHEQGILHRDLKPANVMIDGRGRVRITDFGLAILAEAIPPEDVVAGTPAYMAPEQFAGKEVTNRSDLYSLGLVLYELYTGKRAFDAKTPQEMARLKDESTPTSPSSHVKSIDPSVERAVLRCLERDPADRPASALALVAALPGSDPLAAAVLAGETPSPEMVAAAGGQGGLKPVATFSCLVFILIAFVIASLVQHPDWRGLLDYAPLKRPPPVLVQDATDILESLGYPDSPEDRAFGFVINGEYLDHIERNDRSPNRWERLLSGRPPAVSFWYRQSPRQLRAVDWWPGVVTPNDPYPRFVEEAGLSLDPAGRLRWLRIVPPEQEPSDTSDLVPDWSVLFTAAGLDPAAFAPTTPAWIPQFHCDARAAWEGTYPEDPQIPIQIEAGAYAGRIVSFRIAEPWDWPSRTVPRKATSWSRAWYPVYIAVCISLMVTAVVLARRNIRMGRGDARSATRLALFFFVALIVRWLLAASHVSGVGEFSLFMTGLAFVLLAGALVWAVYIALEPLLRRRWPRTLVSWNRLLAGRFFDPRIGRDVLVGTVAWFTFVVISIPVILAPRSFGLPPRRPEWVPDLGALLGPRGIGSELIDSLLFSIVTAMVYLFLFLLICIVLRKAWLAAVIIFLFIGTGGFLESSSVSEGLISISQNVLFFGTLLFLASRFGLLSLCVFCLNSALSSNLATGVDSDGWYGGISLSFLIALLALVVYGVYASLARRRPLGEDLSKARIHSPD
jgi:serine/threonine-protein kinase